jgi:hypothetical protein|tara:strand:- start:391 stop:588 length:198 start_codon:yes stop_codon:yes gene_type:complete
MNKTEDKILNIDVRLRKEKIERIKDLYYHLEYSDEFFKSDKDEEVFRRIDIKIEELMGLLYSVFK